MLDAAGIRKRYGLRPVLRGLNLRVGPGEIVAILGANGAGKSTLLRVLATLLRPEAGTLVIDGIDALARGGDARARIGVVLHHTMVYPELSGRENLRFHADLRGLNDSAARITAALEQVDLIRRADDLARAYSRGMAQRLSLARALLHEPVLLILDEPFTGLDQASATRLSALLADWARAGKAAVMTTHEVGRGMDAVTRALTLDGGVL
jgi:heme exporter protein A